MIEVPMVVCIVLISLNFFSISASTSVPEDLNSCSPRCTHLKAAFSLFQVPAITCPSPPEPIRRLNLPGKTPVKYCHGASRALLPKSTTGKYIDFFIGRFVRLELDSERISNSVLLSNLLTNGFAPWSSIFCRNKSNLVQIEWNLTTYYDLKLTLNHGVSKSLLIVLTITFRSSNANAIFSEYSVDNLKNVCPFLHLALSIVLISIPRLSLSSIKNRRVVSISENIPVELVGYSLVFFQYHHIGTKDIIKQFLPFLFVNSKVDFVISDRQK